MHPDRLAELEEERRFLLRSLRDLEREHEAGDVDDGDYATLGDGYTARAAAVLRAIDDGRSALPVKRRRRPVAVAAWMVGVIAVASLAGWLVARSSGQRLAGQTITGGQPVDQVAVKLAEARQHLGGDPAVTAKAYGDVLAIDPTNAEARTYVAWLLVLSSRGASADLAATAISDAKQRLLAVIADDPTYADPHCFLAIAVGQFAAVPDLDLARQQVTACLANDPPGDMVGLIQQFQKTLDATAGQ